MRLLLDARVGAQGGISSAWTPNRLMAAKRRSEDLSDVIIRIVKAEAMASNP
jgi:hypothetical protein